MAITAGDFKNIPSSGVIPASRVPCGAFAIGYSFSYEAQTDPTNLSQPLVAKLRVNVVDKDGAVKYAITIEEHYTLIVSGVGVVFVIWSWDANREKVTALKGEGPDAPPMAQFGHNASFGVDTSDSGYSDLTVYLSSTFRGPLFNEPLDLGDKLEIKFHDVSAGFVVSNASLLLATNPVVLGIDTLNDRRTGQTWTLFNDKSGLSCSSTRRSEKYPLSATTPVLDKAASYAQLVRVGATLYAIINESINLHLAVSLDEGETWREPMPLVPGVRVLAATEGANADTLYIYGVASAASDSFALGDILRVVLTRASETEWKIQAQSKVAGQNLPISNVVRLERSQALFRLYVHDGDAIRILTSTDELESFSETV